MPQVGQPLRGRHSNRSVRGWNVGGCQEFSHPQKGPDNTNLASSTVGIRPVPWRLKGTGSGVGHFPLTSGADWGIQPPTTCEQFLTRSYDTMFPPRPPRKPNMNENRHHCNMLGPLRSPPPAASGNWARSIAQRNVRVVLLRQHVKCCLRCIMFCVHECGKRAASL